MTNSERKVKDAKKKQRQGRRREIEDLRWVLGSGQGRRVLWRIMGEAGLFHNSFDSHSGQMSFNCGKQFVGQEVLADILEADSKAFLQMMKEHEEQEQKSEPESGAEEEEKQ